MAQPRREAPPPRDARGPREGRTREARGRDGREPRRPDAPTRARVPHKTYATWEPPVEHDDDKPILTNDTARVSDRDRDRDRVSDTDRPAPPPLPGITESLAPTERAPLGGERHDREARFDRTERTERPERTERTERLEDDETYAQIFVNVGRRDGVRPGDFQRVLEGAIGPTDPGRIRIRDRNTFVSVRRETLDRAVAALSGQIMAGRSVIAEPAKARPERA
jgi:ATP-dependent RNA helicase DeaD